MSVLVFLDEVKLSIGLNEVVSKVGLSRGKALGLLQKLVRDGYVTREGKGYLIATKGQVALKELRPVASGEEFQFYYDLNRFTGVSAKSLGEFLERLRTVDIRVLEFHVGRGDFEAWVRDVFTDHGLVLQLVELRESGIRGEDLLLELSEIVDKKYRELCKLTV
ncbi:MAG: hypothetical protein QG670_93 [Thermoproteota archaeon]|nr:hypothetical protein [Thermoproteota archaeon]